MPRKAHVRKEKLILSPLYKSEAIAKFIHCLMYDGKKSVAERIVYEALEQAGKSLMLAPDEVFEKALENVKPPSCRSGLDVSEEQLIKVPVEVAP